MTDIVERLREDNMSAIEHEAADEIEALRRQNAELRGYLDPLIKEILHRKPYRRLKLYELAITANIGMGESQK